MQTRLRVMTRFSFANAQSPYKTGSRKTQCERPDDQLSLEFTNTEMSEHDWLWAKVIEAYRARMTIALGVFVAMVTLTGYALANKMAMVLLAASAFPALMIGLDAFIERRFVVPFLYALVVSESVGGSPKGESLSFLFLGFAHDTTALASVAGMAPGLQRQGEFLRLIRRRAVLARIVIATAGCLGELVLYAYIRNYGS